MIGIEYFQSAIESFRNFLRFFRVTLQLAHELNAAIVSNDNFRDLINENPAFKKIIENRVISYSWCNDIFIIPKDPYGKDGPNLETILHYF